MIPNPLVLAATLAFAFVAAAPPPASAQAAPSSSAAPSPEPTKSAAEIRDRLGSLDGLAQRIVRTPIASATKTEATEIAARWGAVRSDLVGRGANRSDLVAADSALRSLQSASAAGGDLRRAANALTAAFAPLYPSVGDRVPAGVHRLDFLNRSIQLDVSEGNWTRANSDVVSAFATWRAVRQTVIDNGGKDQVGGFERALAALEDAIAARSHSHFDKAIVQADTSLAEVEKAVDQEEPAWRRFLNRFAL